MSVDRARLPALGADPPFTFPLVHRDRLANGLSIWSIERRGLPVVYLLAIVRAGSAADPADAPGLASFTGDMLDEGSGARSAIQMHEELARIGALFETEVGADFTSVSLTTVSRHLSRALELLADIMVAPRLDAADFARVRDLRLNRLLQLRDQPQALADRALLETVYGSHPYGHLAIGTARSLESLTRDHVVEFHREMYGPERALLIVAGNVDAEAVSAAADRAFGPWMPRSARRFDGDAGLRPPPARPRVGFALVDRPGAAQSELRMGHIAAARDTPDYHALLVLNAALGGQFVSRVNLNLREDKGFTYGARTAFDFRRGRGLFLLQTSVQTRVTGAAVREVRSEILDIRGSRPATAAELAMAHATLTRGYARNFETAEQVARAASQLALYGLPDDYFERFVERVRAVDEAEVTRVAAAFLDPPALATVIVGDRAVVVPLMAAEGYGEPEIIEFG